MVKLSSILVQYGLQKNIVNAIDAEMSNSYGEIDIGKCIGSCRQAQSENPMVSFQKSSFVVFSENFFQNDQLGCVASEYKNLKTKIRIAGETIQGPTIENLVINACVCTPVHICH